MRNWTPKEIQNLSGKTYVVTGASSGLGLASANTLVSKGARVIAAVRNTEKAKQVLDQRVEIHELNLASLASVHNFANKLNEKFDVLLNNAGVMAIPLARTEQGFEMQFGVNHLGHFALTGLLLDRITDRVVTVSSMAHRMGKIYFDDLNWNKKYSKWFAYGQSKLANLLFTSQLDHLFKKSQKNLKAIAAHPGYSDTNLQANSSRGEKTPAMKIANKIMAQSAEQGSWPQLFGATQDIPGNSFVGPNGFGEMKGYPKLVNRSKAAMDMETAAKLWRVSEDLTGVKFNLN
jgi:NAD(P)-dependent dehydrogenase (short-subunit alcohol dehydrogenase family)